MCGLVAVLLYPQARSPWVWQAIWENFTQNLVVNQARGEAATGVAIAHLHRPMAIEKQAQPAIDFIETSAYRALPSVLGADTVLLLGHTRRPTQGSPTHPANNHPLRAGLVTGIHNGHINNNESLFHQWQLPRRATVDSEIIFQLLNHVMLPEGDRGSLPSRLPYISSQLQHLDGRFTFFAFHQYYPHHLLVVRHQNPLSVHFQADWGALIFSSSYLFLRKRFGSAVLHETVPRDQVLLFDATQVFQYHHCAVGQSALSPQSGLALAL
jgi:glucosamine 6-phosphate synthetase-like amidotransferase/phosphosugar isomerase protein